MYITISERLGKTLEEFPGARKPKKDAGPKTNASQPSLKAGGIKGLENMKNG